MNSFIGWIGGKKQLRKTIISMFPQKYDRYIEVFGGAGWVLFGKEPSKFEVYNDTNDNLVNLFKCIKYHAETVQKEFEWVLDSRQQFFAYRDNMNYTELTDIQRAARFLYVVKNSFGTDLKSYATEPCAFDVFSETLTKAKERLNRVVIEHRDFEHLIKTYDRPTALFYLDPPYYKSEYVYQDSFLEEDHKRLHEILSKIKGKFILSYNDADFIRDLYKEYNIIPIERTLNLCSENKNGYKELIIKNY